MEAHLQPTTVSNGGSGCTACWEYTLVLALVTKIGYEMDKQQCGSFFVAMIVTMVMDSYL